ncbi:hypothetical protein PR048_029006 [Dryococelus australis]|uniref:Transposase n=1 Tax=Dryococelus australis TaxID=614101 RepID=A0ABQ9GC56_9NEOP|nr:hypothetical protein PR048_029006 [Dryococelus australis]
MSMYSWIHKEDISKQQKNYLQLGNSSSSYGASVAAGVVSFGHEHVYVGGGGRFVYLLPLIPSDHTVAISECSQITGQHSKTPNDTDFSSVYSYAVRCSPVSVSSGTQYYGTKSNYTVQQLNKAIQKIQTGQIGIKQAVKEYSNPQNMLKNKLRGNYKKNIGRPLVFTPEEDIFKKHAMVLSDMGIPISLYNPRCIVRNYLNSQKRTAPLFKKNMPGWDWRKIFSRRHSDLKAVFGQSISRKHAQVDKDMINKFFDKLERVLVNVPPQNIFNYDETGFHDCPKKGKYLFQHQNRHPEIIWNSTQSCFTVMFCGNASGELSSPYFVFKGKNKMSDWLMDGPKGSRLNVSKSDWVDMKIYEDCICIYPTSRERVIAKLPAYANPAEAQQNMPNTIGEEFKAYVNSMRGEDLVPKQKVKRFHLPACEDAKNKDPSLKKKAESKKSDRPSAAKKKKVTRQVQDSTVTDESSIPVGNYVVVDGVLEPSIDTSSQDQNSGEKIVLGDYVVWLDYSPPTKVNRVRFPAVFLEDLPFPPPLHFGAAPFSPHFTIIDFQVHDVKSRQDLFTSLLHFIPAKAHPLARWPSPNPAGRCDIYRAVDHHPKILEPSIRLSASQQGKEEGLSHQPGLAAVNHSRVCPGEKRGTMRRRAHLTGRGKGRGGSPQAAHNGRWRSWRLVPSAARNHNTWRKKKTDCGGRHTFLYKKDAPDSVTGFNVIASHNSDDLTSDSTSTINLQCKFENGDAALLVRAISDCCSHPAAATASLPKYCENFQDKENSYTVTACKADFSCLHIRRLRIFAVKAFAKLLGRGTEVIKQELVFGLFLLWKKTFVLFSKITQGQGREVDMEQRRNERTGETGDPRESPLTNGIVKIGKVEEENGMASSSRVGRLWDNGIRARSSELFILFQPASRFLQNTDTRNHRLPLRYTAGPAACSFIARNSSAPSPTQTRVRRRLTSLGRYSLSAGEIQTEALSSHVVIMIKVAPGACYPMPIRLAEGSTHPETSRENEVNNPEHSSEIGRKQYGQSPRRASVIRYPSFIAFRRRCYHITLLFPSLRSQRCEVAKGLGPKHIDAVLRYAGTILKSYWPTCPSGLPYDWSPVSSDLAFRHCSIIASLHPHRLSRPALLICRLRVDSQAHAVRLELSDYKLFSVKFNIKWWVMIKKGNANFTDFRIPFGTVLAFRNE